MAGKSYKVARATEPVWFELEYSINDQQLTHRFNCITALPVGEVLDLAAIFGATEDDASNANLVKEVQNLYQKVLLPEDWIVFSEMVRDPDVGIDINLYVTIISDLAAEYTTRPTGANSPSSPQVPSSGTASTDGASVTALTYSRPETRRAVSPSSSTG